ncbi:hypothetical protein TVAG_478710 [Trichomonas vaginalis G3]|uniref:Uncharacterized protein n=1 Tax=Trichomonas vaginalis (strain ATCC PRA-98 / G3) TaxID=412133 RepID=A2DZY7_TRIV3|nr:hypothetical protein TVAGG3_0536150 [Trichomonas vaginalis G3]EAY14046.1 hypothetical protein TVAG_478710 [Trichomonas vaginalis G3]KAI5519512.1 hypothetical protein TVAGG3_0536150 [Trichomonas vaginalis G3]|eukprot:XP_001326269.1 hypothetical protein [Trichomonas vaginalis G3]
MKTLNQLEIQAVFQDDINISESDISNISEFNHNNEIQTINELIKLSQQKQRIETKPSRRFLKTITPEKLHPWYNTLNTKLAVYKNMVEREVSDWKVYLADIYHPEWKLSDNMEKLNLFFTFEELDPTSKTQITIHRHKNNKKYKDLLSQIGKITEKEGPQNDPYSLDILEIDKVPSEPIVI